MIVLMSALLCFETSLAQGTPEVCENASVFQFSIINTWHDDVPPGEIRCLVIDVEAGEKVQAVVKIEEKPPFTGASIELFLPGDEEPTLNPNLGNVNRQSITWKAKTTGPHYLVLRNFWTMMGNVTTISSRVWIEAIQTPAEAAAQEKSLKNDPRVKWLQDNAISVRSIDPDDVDFSDLEPLRDALKDVRLVLLGEADHFSGSDFLAKSRLIKFLHQELGFDVLAMEAPIYDMAVAWDSLKSGAPARESFALGALGQWHGSEQMQPLIEYISKEAAGNQPLELAGFDNQPQMASVRFFVDDLIGFLTEQEIDSPLIDPESTEYGILEALAEVRYRQRIEPIPEETKRNKFLSELDDVVESLSKLEIEAGRFWHRVLHSFAFHGRRVFAPADGVSFWEAAALRNEQMAENLTWLKKEWYQDRKIIAWAGSAHVMRLSEIPPGGGSGPSMGNSIGERFGTESYVIAMVSYQDDRKSIVPDQHSLPEFEELMEAARFEYGFLDIRQTAHEGYWTGNPFLARPIGHVVKENRWSEVLDAFFFIRDQERSRPIGNQ